ncbi:MAG: SpoIID/LytB domain-containing protein [Elusimicrobia bacterium]|nr:SpoIID/LytB domain-containing protein [Elusimicrobiota bacterium]
MSWRALALCLAVSAPTAAQNQALSLNETAWENLSQGKAKEAADHFKQALERSSSSGQQAQARLGLALTALKQSKPDLALEELRQALSNGPYILPAAYLQIARIHAKRGETKAALSYLRQSLELDPGNVQALKEMAGLYGLIKEKAAAWRLYQQVLALDPADDEALRAAGRLAKEMPDVEKYRSVRRLNRPLLAAQAPEKSRPTGELIRVGLFSSPKGVPGALRSLRLTSNSPFEIMIGSSAVLAQGEAYEGWEARLAPDNEAVELRDSGRNLRASSREPLRLVPLRRPGSFLLQEARLEGEQPADPGDRELRGYIELRPQAGGFYAVNELPFSEYLYGAVGAALPPGSPAEAYKAQAVVCRSLALWLKSRSKAGLSAASADLCDSAVCQKYIGVSAEMREASQAVDATQDLVFAFEGHLVPAFYHENCGGTTEQGGQDLAHLASVRDGSASPKPDALPDNFEAWVREAPPRDIFCQAGRSIPIAQSRWIRFIKVSELERRANMIGEVGSIKALAVTERSPGGRVRRLEIRGSRGSAFLEGEKAIADFLSPGSLSSTLFSPGPVISIPEPSIVLWGAGSGSGLGLCQAGAMALAQQGRDWRAILAHYFPRLKIEKRP